MVGDVLVLDGVAYVVDRIGFERLGPIEDLRPGASDAEVAAAVGDADAEAADDSEVRTDGGTDEPTCTDKLCDQPAAFAYWMGDQFSRARDPEDPDLADGDLCPYVCEDCRDRMADSPHYDAERFARPAEKLATDGGGLRDPTDTEWCPECARWRLSCAHLDGDGQRGTGR